MTDRSVGSTTARTTTIERTAERILRNTPEELRRRPQWVVWRYVERDGKKSTKVPYDARTGAKANTADSETWSTFGEAVRAFRGGEHDGVGFVFGSGDPYAGVDLDGCRDPETGELEGWAREIVDSLGGYAEVSPSGTGVHVIVRGDAPNRKRGQVEAYSSRRYFTLTGEALEGAEGRIPKRREELGQLTRKYLADPDPVVPLGSPARHAPRTGGPPTKLSDEEVIERCRKAKNTPKFVSLYDGGDTSGHNNDDSRADLALLEILAFYTQDQTQLERLFDRSELGKRPKWRRRSDYRRRTIEKALQKLGETYSPPRERGARYDDSP